MYQVIASDFDYVYTSLILKENNVKMFSPYNKLQMNSKNVQNSYKHALKLASPRFLQ